MFHYSMENVSPTNKNCFNKELFQIISQKKGISQMQHPKVMIATPNANKWNIKKKYLTLWTGDLGWHGRRSPSPCRQPSPPPIPRLAAVDCKDGGTRGQPFHPKDFEIEARKPDLGRLRLRWRQTGGNGQRRWREVVTRDGGATLRSCRRGNGSGPPRPDPALPLEPDWGADIRPAARGWGGATPLAEEKRAWATEKMGSSEKTREDKKSMGRLAVRYLLLRRTRDMKCYPYFN